MIGQLSHALAVRPRMDEHILEAARRSRLTREELLAEHGERVRPACLCASWEVCLCDVANAEQREDDEALS
jgi:hypothetical protein